MRPCSAQLVFNAKSSSIHKTSNCTEKASEVATMIMVFSAMSDFLPASRHHSDLSGKSVVMVWVVGWWVQILHPVHCQVRLQTTRYALLRAHWKWKWCQLVLRNINPYVTLADWDSGFNMTLIMFCEVEFLNWHHFIKYGIESLLLLFPTNFLFLNIDDALKW